MGDLKNWSDKQSKFIKLGDGDSFTGEYQGFKIGSFRGNDIINYTFKIEGDEKILSSSSGKLARIFDVVPKGETVKITRFGIGFDTTYEVERGPAEEPLPVASTKEVWDE